MPFGYIFIILEEEILSCLYSNGGTCMDKKYTHVSLFCGAGGLDIGLEQAGFKTIWANDYDHNACETHRLWSSAKVVEGDIGKVDFDEIPNADLISGGFPCQGFSLAGPRKLDDSRNVLYRYFVKIVERKQPAIFLAENVKGLLTLGNGKIKEAILNDFESKGYHVSLNLVNAADYGVPQDRHRVIIVGIRNDLYGEGIKFEMPKPFTYKVTLKDAIGGFKAPSPEDVCLAPYSSRYMSRNRKRKWDEVSYTIPAMAKQVAIWPGSPDMIKVDKDLWQFGKGETRRLSFKEAAAIQTFPPKMKFVGNLTSKYKQIGNAVPCQLAKVVGARLVKLFEEIEELKGSCQITPKMEKHLSMRA